MDLLIQKVIESILEGRYYRLREGLALWPWTLGVYLLGFVAVLVLVLLVVLYLTLFERKLLGWIQIRMGPNRVGPWGLLQPFADMIKLLIKEDIVPQAADKWLHLIAPLVVFVPTMLALVVIPFARVTIELKQELVAPTFKHMWVEWLDAEKAREEGYPQQGWREVGVRIETVEATHKTWWKKVELDHEPVFVPADEERTPLDHHYRFAGFATLEMERENPQEEAEPIRYDLMVDYNTSGRSYDVIELRWLDSKGGGGVIELGVDGEEIDRIEKQYAKMVEGIGPDVPAEKRYDFGTKSPQRVFQELFDSFAGTVAVNNRNFSAACMVPVFPTVEGKRLTYRDLYTPNLKHSVFIHGVVERGEKKASLMFFPVIPEGEVEKPIEEVPEDYDWRQAGAEFRIQRKEGGGYRLETRDGKVTELNNLGEYAEVSIGGAPLRVTLKDAQYYHFYFIGKDLAGGVLYLFAAMSLSVLAIFMGGFGSNNKWSLIGAMRSAAQLMSYEIPMTLAVLGPILMAGSLSTVEIVESQKQFWYFIPQFLALYIFVVCATSEVNRNPFDLPEAESELVAGFHTEYSGLKFAFFFLAEYANMFVAAAMITILFFGGFKGPIIPFLGEFLSTFMWFMLKTFFWLGVLIWFRGTFPRFRIDQMMDYAWKVLLPLSMFNIVYTGYLTYTDWHFRIWAQTNYTVWDKYIKPLFSRSYAGLYAIPCFIALVLLFGTELWGLYRDRQIERRKREGS